MSDNITNEEITAEEELKEQQLSDSDAENVSGGYSGPSFTYVLKKD